MLRHNHLEHRFVHYIPEQLEPGIIYISMDYATAAHSCCCGCGEQVITPFSPADWKMTFDGETISLWPSIGNWNFRCRSHYIIRRSQVLGAEPWNHSQVEKGRRRDKSRNQQHYDEKSRSENHPPVPPVSPKSESLGLWDRIKKKTRKGGLDLG
jgi:hypothetical protein